MARILISFLGTGPRKQAENGDVKNDRIPRKYRPANYHIGGENLGDFSFVSLALHKKFQFDKIFLIGTARSIWEEAYNQFRGMNEGAYDQDNPDDVYYELLEACDANDYTSPLTIPHKEQVEAAMPKGSKVVLIKYGLNEEEIKENSNIVLSLADDIRNNDELFVDVTHSFRSLPFIVMQLILYLRTIKPGSKISHIFYGMLDITSEMKYTPIVDLKSLLTVNDWITGAYSFLNFGSAYQIAELLGHEEFSDAKRLTRFSDAMNLNHLDAIRKEAQSLSAIKDREYNDKLAGMVITPTVNEFVKRFVNIRKQSVFQLRLAEWQFQHLNYASAYISAIEAIISYVCEINELDINDYNKREDAKEILRSNHISEGTNCPDELHGQKGIFQKMNKNRNALAHSLETINNCSQMIKQLKESLNKLASIIK